MGKNLNIYLDDQSNLALLKKKEDYPDFNLSAFIQSKLMENEDKQKDPSELLLQIKYKKTNIDNLKNDVDFLEEKHRKLILELESNKKDEIADKMKQEKIKDQRQNEIADSLMKFFSIEIIPAKELAEKFLIQKEMNKDLNIFQFMMGKGYEEIPVVLPIKTE